MTHNTATIGYAVLPLAPAALRVRERLRISRTPTRHTHIDRLIDRYACRRNRKRYFTATVCRFRSATARTIRTVPRIFDFHSGTNYTHRYIKRIVHTRRCRCDQNRPEDRLNRTEQQETSTERECKQQYSSAFRIDKYLTACRFCYANHLTLQLLRFSSDPHTITYKYDYGKY